MNNGHYYDILRKYWGYQNFRSIQLSIIESIGNGHDTLGLMPTGGGKSITFQVPALAMDGVCIVITPLVALMKDQVENLKKRNIRAAAIHSGLRHDQIITILENCVFGAVKLLYVSPERLSSKLFLTKLRHINVSFITVDEAHCITQWGYDFRPSYLKIAELRSIIPDKPILALTATATEEVVDDIQEKLHFREKNVFKMSFERKNLAYMVRLAENKQEEMVHILKKINGSAIVYVKFRSDTDFTAQYLNDAGISATYYHAGLDNNIKDERQELWQNDKVKVMVATNAFGMGIDKPDVRAVIHLNAPDNIESYFQEAGRAGRDGEKAYAIMLVTKGDTNIMRKKAASNIPDKQYIKQVYEHVSYFFQIAVGSGYGMAFKFNIQKFCRNFRHYPTRVEAALKILEQAGYIEYENDEDRTSRVMFIPKRDELYKIKNSSKTEDLVIETILRKYNGLFVDYAIIDEENVAHQCQMEEEEVHECLKLLARKRIIAYIPPRNSPIIKFTQPRELTERIVIPYNIYERRIKKMKERLDHMINYMTCDTECRSIMLLRYFGEKSKNKCGICDVCELSHATPVKDMKEAAEKMLRFLDDGKPHPYNEIRHFDPQIETSALQDAIDWLLSEQKITTDGINVTIIK